MFEARRGETPRDRYSQTLKDGLAEARDEDDDHVAWMEEWMIDGWRNEEGEGVIDGETGANER